MHSEKSYLEHAPFPFAANNAIPVGSVLEFKDWRHLVELVADHYEHKESVLGSQSRSMWLLPKRYNNAFFDLAFFTKVEATLVCHTLQVTCALKHSCNASVMQLIANELALKGLSLTKVIHHGVIEKEREFSFNTMVAGCIRRSTRGQRQNSGQQIMTSEGELTEKFLPGDELATMEGLLSKTENQRTDESKQEQDDAILRETTLNRDSKVSENEHVAELEKAIGRESFRGTEVQVGRTLIVKDALVAMQSAIVK